MRLGGLKMAIDGGTSSHTAFMYAPFEGEATVGNFNRLDPAQLRRYFRTAGARLGRGHPHLRRPGHGHGVDAFSEVVRSYPTPTRATTSSTPTSRRTAPWTRWAGTTSAR
ncbi:MAG: hypothetical protein R2854_17015 [Caldilineaceae bacterium]